MIPNYKQNTSLTLMPDVPGMSIPLAYGWNVFFALGKYVYKATHDQMPVSTAALRTLQAAFDAWSPIGSGSESKTLVNFVGKTLTPSFALPVVEFMANENRFGAPIYKDQNSNSNVEEANAYMHFNSVNPISKWAMQRFAEVGAGGKNARYSPGPIDVNPAMVDHFINSYLPGMLAATYNTAGITVTKAQGYTVDKETKVPFVDRFTAKADPVKFDAAADRRVRIKVDTLWKAWSAPDTTLEEKEAIEKEYPQLGYLKDVTNSTDAAIKRNRQALAVWERVPGISEEAKVQRRNEILEIEKRYHKLVVEAALKSGFRDVVVGVD